MNVLSLARFCGALIFATLIVMGFQNCSFDQDVIFGSDSIFSSKDSLSRNFSGNGEPYEGKLSDGIYLRSVPGHVCEKENQFFGSIKIKDGEFFLNTAESSANCEKVDRSLHPSRLRYSSYNKGYLIYKEGVYISEDLVRSRSSKNSERLEVLCQAASGPNTGIDLMVHYEAASGRASVSVIKGQRDGSDLVVYRVPDFYVERSNGNSNLLYSNIGFRLGIDSSKYVQGEVGAFAAKAEMVIGNQAVSIEQLTCRLAGDLDGQHTQLKFTGLSDPSVALSSKIFDETMNPAWQLNGQCHPNNGSVKISGSGLIGEHLANCGSNGQFSWNLNQADFRNGSDGKSPYGSRRVTISQFPAAPQTTTLVKASSSFVTEIVSSAVAMQAMVINDPNRLYVLSRDIDLGMEVSATNNWTPIGSHNIVDPTKDHFLGHFDGNYHSVDNLHIDIVNGIDGIAFFGAVKSAYIENVIFRNSFVKSSGLATRRIGTVSGHSENTGFHNIMIESGEVEGATSTVGGLTGYSLNGSVSGIKFSGIVRGNAFVGGIVGWSQGSFVTSSYSDAEILGSTSSIGGVIGSYSYSVTGTNKVSNVAAHGTVRGISNIGGLVGVTVFGVQIMDSYANVDVYGHNAMTPGPLVGEVLAMGGVGNQITILRSYWNSDRACPSCMQKSGGVGLGEKSLLNRGSYDSQWNFKEFWEIHNYYSFPIPRSCGI